MGLCINISRFQHLIEYEISSSLSSFGISHRIVSHRCFQHGYKHGRFRKGKFFGGLVEIDLRSHFNTVGIIKKIKFIEVFLDDFFLRISFFQADRYYPFFNFLNNGFRFVVGSFPCEKQLRQLLGDGTSAASFAPKCYSTHDSLQVDPGMFLESFVFFGLKRIYQMRRQVPEINRLCFFFFKFP